MEEEKARPAVRLRLPSQLEKGALIKFSSTFLLVGISRYFEGWGEKENGIIRRLSRRRGVGQVIWCALGMGASISIAEHDSI